MKRATLATAPSPVLSTCRCLLMSPSMTNEPVQHENLKGLVLLRRVWECAEQLKPSKPSQCPPLPSRSIQEISRNGTNSLEFILSPSPRSYPCNPCRATAFWCSVGFDMFHVAPENQTPSSTGNFASRCRRPGLPAERQRTSSVTSQSVAKIWPTLAAAHHRRWR